MSDAIHFAMMGFYTGIGLSLSLAIYLAWKELNEMNQQHQARKPRLMATYNQR